MRKWNLIVFLFFLVLFVSGQNAFARTTKKTHLTPHKQQHAAQKKISQHSAKKTHLTQHKKPTTTPHKIAKRHNLPSHGSNQNAIHASSNLPVYLYSESEQNLVDFVHTMVSRLHYSTYRLGGTYINSSKGEYVVDCSTYVDHVLKSVYPHAYQRLSQYSQSQKPTSDDFYHYFTEVANQDSSWNAINDVSQLRPGDILVFRYTNHVGDETGGHVMIVMDKPRAQDNFYAVRVADSASDGHSQDTRRPHSSGVGIGTLLLQTDHTQRPKAFAWKAGSRWQSNVAFAMGRPREHA